MENAKTNPEQLYKSLMVVWAALLMSQFIFILIVFITKPGLFAFDFTRPVLGDSSAIIASFAAVAITTLTLSFVLKRRFLARSVEEHNMGLVQTATIVPCALAEVASLLGLLLAFAFDYQYFFLFSILGTIGILLHFPKRDAVHAASFQKVA